MITLTNYNSGRLVISFNDGESLQLTRDQANRLIMAARMHSVDDFIVKLPTLMSSQDLATSISAEFNDKTSTERWTLKEKFARLGTIIKGFELKEPESVVEEISFC
jgi:hypothetical protein